MRESILTEELTKFFNANPFVNLATCDLDFQPNVAPKFILKIHRNKIYLGDYNIDRTWTNVNFNSKVSLASINLETLVGYQINGIVEVLEDESLVKRLLKEFGKKKILFSTKRVIKGVHDNKTHKDFELIFPERVIIYKVTAYEVIEIKPQGSLEQRLAK